MANIPSNLSYATVNGRFIVGYQDSADGGSEPDAIPAAGTIIFSPSTSLIKNVSASGGPVSIVPATVQATLDEEGYLCGYGSTRGIILVATDDTDGNPYDWTWRAEFRLTESDGTPIAVEGFSFELPGGSNIDLTVLAPVQLANGTFYNVGPQGPQGIQGIQGPQGSIENFIADAPLAYDPETATITFDDTDYVYTAGDNIAIVANEIAVADSPTFTGTVSGITKSMVGLANVDNTTDANKPVSSATQTALDLKANLAGATFTGTITTSNGITNAQQKNALVASGFNSASGAFAQASRVIMTATATGSTAPTTRPDGTSLVAGDVWISF
jgi:hypothetical protein